MKCIYKLDFLTSTIEVTRISGVEKMLERSNSLNERYLQNCIKFRNPLIVELINQYKDGSKNFTNKTFLCKFKDIFKTLSRADREKHRWQPIIINSLYFIVFSYLLI